MIGLWDADAAAAASVMLCRDAWGPFAQGLCRGSFMDPKLEEQGVMELPESAASCQTSEGGIQLRMLSLHKHEQHCHQSH